MSLEEGDGGVCNSGICMSGVFVFWVFFKGILKLRNLAFQTSW